MSWQRYSRIWPVIVYALALTGAARAGIADGPAAGTSDSALSESGGCSCSARTPTLERARLARWVANDSALSESGGCSRSARTPTLELAAQSQRDWPYLVRAGQSRSDSPTSRTTREMCGWTVRIDDRLLTGPNAALGERAIKLLDAKLNDITYVMEADHLVKLRSVTIVLDLTNGGLHNMQYHPSADWLRENGYSAELAKCVHIPDAAEFARARNVNEQPWVILHELSHAYHDQVLGFDEPRILKAYEDYKKSGHGDNTLLFDGRKVRHYALTDHKEFFAEMTEAYFGENDFFPFNRAELITAEPEIYQLLKTIWGPVQTGRPKTGDR